MSTFTRRFLVGEVLTDVTSAKLSDPTGTYGVKRNDTDAVVVADDTDMTHIGVGTYRYTFDDPALDLTYTYWVEFVYMGATHRFEGTLPGPSSTSLIQSQAHVINYIQRKFGSPTVQVELTDLQLEDAVNDALRLVTRYLFIRRPEAAIYAANVAEMENIGVGQQTNYGQLDHNPVRAGSVQFSDGVQLVTDDGNGNLTGNVDTTYPANTIIYASGRYDFRFAAAPGLTSPITATYQYVSEQEGYSGSVVIDWPDDALGVLYCAALRPRSYQTAFRASIFELMFRMLPSRLSVGEWYEARSMYEAFQRVRGTYPAWLVDRENRKLYVDCSAGPYEISIIWAKEIDITALLSGAKKAWKREFLDAAMAYAKETLANVRGKFGAVPVPGGSLTTDAERLATQARATLEKVEDKLKRASRLHLRPQFD